MLCKELKFNKDENYFFRESTFLDFIDIGNLQKTQRTVFNDNSKQIFYQFYVYNFFSMNFSLKNCFGISNYL